jgi:hypothetical protein
MRRGSARWRGRIGGKGCWRTARFDRAGELAEAEGVTRSFVNRLLRLTLLTLEIVESILDGRRRRACNWRC